MIKEGKESCIDTPIWQLVRDRRGDKGREEAKEGEREGKRRRRAHVKERRKERKERTHGISVLKGGGRRKERSETIRTSHPSEFATRSHV